MVGRAPCRVCNQQISSPNNFLLRCACGIVCHHRCLEPPMAHSSLLVMIDAFNRGVHEESILSWRCAACMGTESKLVKPLQPIPARLPGCGDKAARYLPAEMRHARQKEKKIVVNEREHGWREHVPAQLNPSHPKPQMDHSAGLWPPVRHKKKPLVSSVMKESHGTSTDLKVAPSGAGGRMHLKPSAKPYSKATIHSLQSSQPDHLHPGHAFITASTRTKSNGTVEDVISNPLVMTPAGPIPLNTTQSPFLIPHSATMGLSNLSLPPIASGRLRRVNEPDPTPGQEATLTPSAPTPPILRPPLIDLHRIVKRKRGAVLRKSSTTDSAVEGPSHKRRRLEMSNNRKDLQAPSGQPDTATPKQNDVVEAAEDRHAVPVYITLPPNAQRDEHPHECDSENAAMLDVQNRQTVEWSQQQCPGSGTVHNGVDHQSGDETKPIPQLASPATSHRSVNAASSDAFLPLATKPGILPAAALSPSREPLPIRNHIYPESHLLLPPPLTPRSLSPSRHTVTKDVLDIVITRLQQQARHRDQRQLAETLASQVRMPQLVRWFKDVGPMLSTATTREKRRRRKKPSAKAVMVGVSEGWTFVGAQFWTTR